MINLKLQSYKIFEKVLTLFDKDVNNREIIIYKLENSSLASNSIIYPNILFKSKDQIVTPLNEKIMSLSEANSDHIDLIDNYKVTKNIDIPLFFFIYNTDNYYHYIYDTLPYLISYFELKKEIKNLKLLMSYPNPSKKEQYKFVIEFLEILGIEIEDILLIEPGVNYKEIYISDSYTHDGKSNLPPRQEIYPFYKKIVQKSIDYSANYPKKIYVSRRTWIHNNLSNIGTNYTNRRKLIIEDELVEFLKKENYTEIFTENLSTIEKLNLFYNASNVIGAIGGGICNVLFSQPETNLLSIVSPDFLNVNKRFLYSFDNIKCQLFENTHHMEKTNFKKYMRCQYNNIIGEIIEVFNDKVLISYTDEFLAGWNNNLEYKIIEAPIDKCIKLDNGLNSAWTFDLNEIKHFVL